MSNAIPSRSIARPAEFTICGRSAKRIWAATAPTLVWPRASASSSATARPSTVASLLMKNSHSPSASASAICDAPANPRFVSDAITRTSANSSASISREPSVEAFSITTISVVASVAASAMRSESRQLRSNSRPL